MRIGIEGTAVIRDQQTGVDYYTQQLLNAMAKARPAFNFDLAYFRFFTKARQASGLSSPNIVEHKNSWVHRKAYSFLYRLGMAPPFDILTGTSCDFYLFPNFIRWPLARSKHSGIIVYDLSFLRSQKTMTRRLRTFLQKKVPKSIAKSDIIFTISETIRHELIEEFAIKPSKIHVAFPAVAHSLFLPVSKDRSKATLAEYGLCWRKFILFVGTIEPRKNLERLMNAYVNLPLNMRTHFPLILVGGKGWMDKGIFHTFEELRQQGCDIRMLGYVPRDKLPILYSSSSAFVFPSLYEGFGMPVLEAMACGTPVITSSCSSLPEVAGDAGLLVNPEDTCAITEAIESVLGDTVLADRMREAGIHRASCFSWESSAKVVLNAIESCIGEGGSDMTLH